MSEILYSWCFSHGRLHAYPNHSDSKACTANRVYLDVKNTEEAMELKKQFFGETEFDDKLLVETQLLLAEGRQVGIDWIVKKNMSCLFPYRGAMYYEAHRNKPISE